jgi:cystathionine gamma-synthase
VIDPADTAALARALEKPTSLFFSESPTNPYLRVVDVPRVAELCRARGALVVIDSTFASPVNQRALELGADLVLHSATKYLGGHNDVMAGAVAGSAELVQKVRALNGILGSVLDPHAAYLLLRGMKTLALRVERQNTNALELARWLERHAAIERVHYPGLDSHPDHAVAVRQMKGFGCVVSFEVRGNLERASKFIDALRLPYIAPSLAGVESLVEQPTVMSYWDQSPEERARIGIRDNLVRYSCGIEDTADIIDDVRQALERV